MVVFSYSKFSDLIQKQLWKPGLFSCTSFLFSSNCCDQYNVAYDENCKAICAPSGGIAGSGDRKCLDFSSTAKFVKLVWKDPR